MNAGKKTLDWLYHEQLKVDEQWSVQTGSGFIWWADKHAQNVEIVGCSSPQLKVPSKIVMKRVSRHEMG
jgi:hypothetical protein